jgi:hypothetical protein
MQIQALFRAAWGTCLSKSALNCTLVHQHGPDAAWPGVAMAQALGCPHKGQRQGSRSGWVMKKGRSVFALATPLRITPQTYGQHHQGRGVQEKVKDVDGFAQSAVQKHAPFFGQVRFGHKRGACQVNGQGHQQPFGYPINPAHRTLQKSYFQAFE